MLMLGLVLEEKRASARCAKQLSEVTYFRPQFPRDHHLQISLFFSDIINILYIQ